jgi:hypothetical protein
MGSDQRDEVGRGQPGVGHQPAGFLVEGGDLLAAAGPDRMDEPAPGGELLDQRRRDARGGGRDHDRLVGGVVGDAQGPITDHHPDLVQSDRGQVGPRLLGQGREALDRHHVAGQPGQDGALEPEPGADLQDPLASVQSQCRHHLGDQAGLGGHLPVADPDRLIQVGLAGGGRRQEPGPGHLSEGGQDPAVPDPPGPQHPGQVFGRSGAPCWHSDVLTGQAVRLGHRSLGARGG